MYYDASCSHDCDLIAVIRRQVKMPALAGHVPEEERETRSVAAQIVQQVGNLCKATEFPLRPSCATYSRDQSVSRPREIRVYLPTKDLAGAQQTGLLLWYGLMNLFGPGLALVTTAEIGEGMAEGSAGAESAGVPPGQYLVIVVTTVNLDE